MLVRELFEDIDLAARRRERERYREVSVGKTVAMVNPHPNDLAKMLVRSSKLRALSSPGTFVVWPAEDELHQFVQRQLDMEDRTKRYFVKATSQGRFKIGRFHVDVDADNRDRVEPWMMADMMQRALGAKI